MRDWARRDPGVAGRLAGVDERRMAYMRTLFGQVTDDPLDAEARCLVAYPSTSAPTSSPLATPAGPALP